MMEIKEPTKLDLIEIIEGLLLKKHERGEVIEWQKQVCKAYDYYGPGVLFVPLNNEEGYWFFVSLSILLEINKINDEKEYFIREKDLECWLNDLRGVESENICPQIKNIKITNKKNWKVLSYLAQFNDRHNAISRKESFNFERGILDNLGDLTEAAVFEYKKFYFGIQKSYKHFLGRVDLAGEENTPEIIVASLLEYLGVQMEDIIDVNEGLYKGRYKLVRMDDNGIKYVINENINYIEAYLKQKSFEQGKHKQSYWIE